MFEILEITLVACAMVWSAFNLVGSILFVVAVEIDKIREEKGLPPEFTKYTSNETNMKWRYSKVGAFTFMTILFFTALCTWIGVI